MTTDVGFYISYTRLVVLTCS